MKKLTSIIIAALVFATSFAVAVNADDNFSDVNDPAQVYYRAVYWAVDEEIVKGFGDGTFRPEASCTREQFVTFIYRLAGKPDTVTEESPFSDIEKGRNTFKPIMWAVEEGIIKGFSDGTFRPEQPVLRKEAAIMLWRMNGKDEVEADAVFSDVSSSDSFYNAVLWGNDAGIMKGYEDGTFRPGDECLRMHIVIFLHRYSKLEKSEQSNSSAKKILEQAGNTLWGAFCWSRDITYYKYQPEAGTVEGWAEYAYTNYEGDCLGKACSFCLMARELGYDAHVVRGVVPLRAGGWGDHAWVEIDMEGTTYVFDPQFAQQTGLDGYMFFYKTPGTWVYSDYARIN